MKIKEVATGTIGDDGSTVTVEDATASEGGFLVVGRAWPDWHGSPDARVTLDRGVESGDVLDVTQIGYAVTGGAFELQVDYALSVGDIVHVWLGGAGAAFEVIEL